MSQRSNRKKLWPALHYTIGASLAALAIHFVAIDAAPTPLDVTPASLPCGFSVDAAGVDAFYTHCDERTRVAVYIEFRAGLIGEQCFGPGTHRLGSTAHVEYAYYAGRLC